MKDDLLYIDHVIETSETIASYIADVLFDDFESNGMLYDAVIRNLQVLSESTQKISLRIKEKYEDIPWKSLSGFRNILVHDYLEGINPVVVWNVVVRDLPMLYENFLIMRDELQRTSHST
ncbi:DUF86 domain-containing protein [Alphaproteobacteria bacterium]|nr:DUF86 domain-containing protein [Alphaproteobacteria bacterium]